MFLKISDVSYESVFDRRFLTYPWGRELICKGSIQLAIIKQVGTNNRPLPSSKNPHFQNEAGCSTFLVKMSSICMGTENDFHIKVWAPTLVLKQRPGGTRKWPISRVGAARMVSPNWSQETMTCHSFNRFSIVWGQGNATRPPHSLFYRSGQETFLFFFFNLAVITVSFSWLESNENWTLCLARSSFHPLKKHWKCQMLVSVTLLSLSTELPLMLTPMFPEAFSCWCLMKNPDRFSCLGYPNTPAINHVKCHGRFLVLFFTYPWIFYSGNIPRESSVAYTNKISRGKSVPCNRT